MINKNQQARSLINQNPGKLAQYQANEWPLVSNLGSLEYDSLMKLFNDEFISVSCPPNSQEDAKLLNALLWLEKNGLKISWFGIGAENGWTFYEVKLLGVSDKLRTWVRRHSLMEAR